MTPPLLGADFARRLAAGVVCSLVLHLSLVALALWARSWLPLVVVRKGEPVIVELPPVEPEEPAPRGMPARPALPAVAAKPKAGTPRPAPKVEAPRPVAPQPSPRAPEPVRAPEPTVVATAEPPPAPEPTVVAKAEPPPAPEPVRPPSPAPKEPEAQRLPEPEARPAAPAPAAPAEPEGPRVAPGASKTDLAALPPGPGSGGIGGIRRGRGGLEGEPIPLDTADPRYTDYFEKVRRQIKSKWIYPREAGERGIGGQLVIDFAIAKSGDLEAVELRRSSGVQVLDLYALNAIKLAQPFPPVPDSVSKGVVPIKGIFTYQIVDAGLLNQYLR